MNNTSTFYVRRNKSSNRSTSSTDAIKLIDYILSLDKDNRIVPNGKLYKLAVNQYNETVHNTLVRQPIPQWFCGKIDQTNGLLLETGTDIEIRASMGLTSPETSATSTITDNLSSYLPDGCLPVGTPGSVGYANCKSSQTENDDIGIDLSEINWSTEVYSVAEAPPLPENKSGPKRHMSDNIKDFFKHAPEVVAISGGALVGGPIGAMLSKKLIEKFI